MRWLTASFKLTSTVWLDKNSKKVWKVKELYKSELIWKVLQNLRLQGFSGILRWLVGTKHFQESKTRPKNQKHIQESKKILDSGTCFGFWEVFCSYEPR